MQTLDTMKQPSPTKKSGHIQKLRLAGYERNMAAMRDYKAHHPCAACGYRFPQFVMEFASPKKAGDWSISRLAGSRCTLDALQEAMKNTELLCANCKRIAENKAAARKR